MQNVGLGLLRSLSNAAQTSVYVNSTQLNSTLLSRKPHNSDRHTYHSSSVAWCTAIHCNSQHQKKII